MADLESIFETLPPHLAKRNENGEAVVPLSSLPQLLDAYDEKRGTSLLGDAEREQLINFAEMHEMDVSLTDLLGFLPMFGATAPVQQTSSESEEHTMPSSTTSEHAHDTVPLPALSALADAEASSPRRRTLSALSTSSATSLRSGIPIPTSDASSPKRANRRSALFHFSPSSRKNSAGPHDEEEHDLSSAVASVQGTYLGVQLDGPLGSDISVEEQVDRVRSATKGAGTRDKELIAIFAHLTFPQIRAIDRAYKTKHGKTLLELFEDEKLLRGHIRFALDGLVSGPLRWDVSLVSKALDSKVSKNELLLTDLIIGRTPDDLSLLRAAYARRYGNSKHKSLNDAVIAAFPKTSEAKLRLAWHTALEGRWLDAEGSQEHSSALLGQDIDQLKVSLRPQGNLDNAIKILLGRSPSHLHSVQVEYLRKTQIPLTRAVKRATSSGTLQQVLLHALQVGKKDVNEPGVWLEAKLLRQVLAGPGTKNEALTWRLLRAHWDRPRFKLIQAAFHRQNPHKSLFQKVVDDTSGGFRDLLKEVIASTDQAEPQATPGDLARLAALSTRSRSRSSSLASSVEESAPPESSTLEGDGELSQPPSPRSPPPADDDGDTPHQRSFSRFPDPIDMGDEPEAESSRFHSSTSALNLNASTSSNTSTDSTPFATGHKLSSSLSTRQRSNPLETTPMHRSTSSLGKLSSSTDRPGSASSARIVRPTAPGRRRRASEDMRAGSEEPTSPVPWGTCSPTPSSSTSDRAQSPAEQLTRSSSSLSQSRRETSGIPVRRQSAISPSPSEPNILEDGSPAARVDNTSYHATPLSPVGDVGSPDSHLDAPPEPLSFGELGMPLTGPLADYFSGNDSSPEKGPSYLRRQGSTASNASTGSSRPGSMFLGEAFGSGGRDSMASLNFGNVFGGRPGSVGGIEQQYAMMLRQASELAKKLKESEARFETSASAYEEEHSELEARLEEARAELQTRRREEKELRSSEKQHLGQISSLETDIAKLTKSLERSREQYETMKRNYQDQCSETEKLRALVNETRAENRAAEEAAQQHNLQIQQSERDREILQSAISKLEGDLASAKSAQDSLDDQKQENLVLKETIDRLRFDLDELRSAGRKSTFLDGTGSAGSSDRAGGASLPGTMSKSLGNELARRLAEQGNSRDAESESQDEDEDDGDEERDEEVDDIVVTTHRRVKKRVVRAAGAAPVEPTITHVEETTHVADAETQTFAPAMTEMDVQTDLSAVVVDLIAAPAVEPLAVPSVPPLTEAEKQEELARGLGVDINRLQELIKTPQSSTPPFGESQVLNTRRLGRLSSRFGQRASTASAMAPSYFISVLPPSARPYLESVMGDSSAVLFFSLSIFLVGVISGAIFLPLTHHHHLASGVPYQLMVSSHDRANWHQFNNFATSWGEGLGGSSASGGIRDTFRYWINEVVWGGVSVVKRVPV